MEYGISRCPGSLTRWLYNSKKDASIVDPVGEIANNRRVNTFRLLFALLGMILLCEILNNGVIIKQAFLQRKYAGMPVLHKKRNRRHWSLGA